jgi:hypothetical protein
MRIPKNLIQGGEQLNNGLFYGKAVSEFTREELLGLAYFFMTEMEEYKEMYRRSYTDES